MKYLFLKLVRGCDPKVHKVESSSLEFKSWVDHKVSTLMERMTDQKIQRTPCIIHHAHSVGRCFLRAIKVALARQHTSGCLDMDFPAPSIIIHKCVYNWTHPQHFVTVTWANCNNLIKVFLEFMWLN